MLFSSVTVFAQQNTATKPIVANKFKAFNRTVSMIKEEGTTVIKLNEAEGPGIAWIKALEFTNGVIDLDIQGKDLLQQSFVGVAFHGVNDTTYEAVYFRPFNFSTSDPIRKLHAVQYIANPQFDWPKLRTDFPNQYEKPVTPAPDPNKWFHVRLQIKGRKVSVFINGNTLPMLAIEGLVDTGGKMVGYWVGNGSAGKWKNLNITAIK